VGTQIVAALAELAKRAKKAEVRTSRRRVMPG
jgi:hypothetical protein